MPKLWDDSIEAHRRAVRDATLDAAAALVAERGPTGVTMSEVAKRTGLGRATLYKYFPDVEAILVAWHERQVGNHLAQLVAIDPPTGRLEAVLEAYALICHEHPATEPAASLHRAEHVKQARQRLVDYLAEVLAESEVRNDVPPKELATYCVHALTAAGAIPSKAAVRRLVAVTLAGLRGEPSG
ncbi:TetR/AcrR family transcriptional regulator [Kribbella sp. NBC_00889]|uniref:TetR/AcrR family transcriptional regulator n=1 Tax=Kribbella sp. NBC_00889 TaxID=2975974 RepID=UPI003867884D|nr:TetR/AcrR family transcriptional regulator [Kribbella sp. NBC_00889]